jgi:predicted DNA-binding transcriptional regulator AlpA
MDSNPVLLNKLPKDAPRLITQPTFYRTMLGVTRNWYYRHKDEPGMPRPIMLGRRVLLLYSECVAYVEQQAAKRAA